MSVVVNTLFSENAPNSRLVDLLQGFCGDSPECYGDQFIVAGTGQVIEISNRQQSSLEETTTDATATVVTNLARRMDGSILPILLFSFLLPCLLAVVVVVAYYYSAKSIHSNKREKNCVEAKSAVSGESITNPQVSDIMSTSSDDTCSTCEDVCSEHESAGTPISTGERNLTKNSDELVSQATMSNQQTLTLTESELRRHGGEIARNMSVIMSEFETAMNQQGYVVSQSDSLAIASQRLMILESQHLAKAAEARKYLYDSQQRNVDRLLADRRHLDHLDSQERDKEWFRKLQEGRDNFVKAILPAIQKGCVAVALFYGVVQLHNYTNANVHRTIFGELCHLFSPNYSNFPGLQIAEDPRDCISVSWLFSGAGWWHVATQVMLFFSRAWKFVLLPLFGLGMVATAHFFLPSFMIQVAKILFISSFIFWMASSVPWKELCLGQALFWLAAQIWAHVVFEGAICEPLRSRTCLTNAEVVRHLLTFDQASHLMGLCACLMNLVIIKLCAR